jgi:hypothetical protein
VRVCGNFRASCNDDSQCAFNSCIDDTCSGPVVIALGAHCGMFHFPLSCLTLPNENANIGTKIQVPAPSASTVLNAMPRTAT